MSPKIRAHFRLFLLTVLTTLVGPTLTAQDEIDQFRVEIIVLRHLNPVFGSEVWPQPEASDEVPIPAERFSPLPADDLTLSDLTRRLANSKSYRVVSHSGWIQPGYSRENARRKVIVRRSGTGESVRGHAIVSRERYLRLELDLVITIDGAQYQLKTARRMLSRQAHYFDHPHFAAIAVIAPL